MDFLVYIVLLLFPISLLHSHVHAEGIKSRCESPATYMGNTGSVTCYFSVDLKQSSKSFRLYRYSMDPTNIRTRDELVVLECYWLTFGDMQCEPPAPGYEFNGTVSNQVRVTIPKASPDFQGKYECRAEPSYPRDVKDCVFLIKSFPEPTAGQTGDADNDEDSSKTVGIAVGVVAILLAAVAVVLVMFRKRFKDRLSFCGRRTTTDRSPAEPIPSETETPLIASYAKEQSTVTGLPEGHSSTVTGKSEDKRLDRQNRTDNEIDESVSREDFEPAAGIVTSGATPDSSKQEKDKPTSQRNEAKRENQDDCVNKYDKQKNSTVRLGQDKTALSTGASNDAESEVDVKQLTSEAETKTKKATEIEQNAADQEAEQQLTEKERRKQEELKKPQGRKLAEKKSTEKGRESGKLRRQMEKTKKEGREEVERQNRKAEMENNTAVEIKKAAEDIERKKAVELERTRLEEERKQLDKIKARLHEDRRQAMERKWAVEEMERETALKLERSRLEEERKAVERQKAEAELERKTTETKMAKAELERTKAMARLEVETKQLERRQAQVENEKLAVEKQKAEAEKERERQRAEAEIERKRLEKMKAEAELEQKAAEKERVNAKLERTALEEERVRLEEERKKEEERWESLKRQVQAAGGYRILLMGTEGTGKSSTGNTILGETKFHASTGFGQSSTETCKLERGHCLGRTAEIMDTPGLMYTHRSNEDVVKEIARGVAEMSRGFHVVLWFVRSEWRYTGANHFAYNLFKTLFGKDVTTHMIVMFTRGDHYLDANVTFETRLKAAHQNLQEVLRDCDHRYILFNNNASATAKVTQLENLFSVIDTLLAQNGAKSYRQTLNVREAIRQK